MNNHEELEGKSTYTSDREKMEVIAESRRLDFLKFTRRPTYSVQGSPQ